jgi:hypothetical protein
MLTSQQTAMLEERDNVIKNIQRQLDISFRPNARTLTFLTKDGDRIILNADCVSQSSDYFRKLDSAEWRAGSSTNKDIDLTNVVDAKILKIALLFVQHGGNCFAKLTLPSLAPNDAYDLMDLGTYMLLPDLCSDIANRIESITTLDHTILCRAFQQQGSCDADTAPAWRIVYRKAVDHVAQDIEKASKDPGFSELPLTALLEVMLAVKHLERRARRLRIKIGADNTADASGGAVMAFSTSMTANERRCRALTLFVSHRSGDGTGRACGALEALRFFDVEARIGGHPDDACAARKLASMLVQHAAAGFDRLLDPAAFARLPVAAARAVIASDGLRVPEQREELLLRFVLRFTALRKASRAAAAAAAVAAASDDDEEAGADGGLAALLPHVRMPFIPVARLRGGGGGLLQEHLADLGERGGEVYHNLVFEALSLQMAKSSASAGAARGAAGAAARAAADQGTEDTESGDSSSDSDRDTAAEARGGWEQHAGERARKRTRYGDVPGLDATNISGLFASPASAAATAAAATAAAARVV